MHGNIDKYPILCHISTILLWYNENVDSTPVYPINSQNLDRNFGYNCSEQI